MSNFISGENLLTRLDIFPFELFDYVKKGLQPFDKFGKPISPPNITDKLERLKKIKMQLGENPRMLHLAEDTVMATSLQDVPDFDRVWKEWVKTFQGLVKNTK